jgi:hypothetical protein
MWKAIVLSVLICAGLIFTSGITGAQTPTPQPPTPIVITATPMPQVIVVTATPSVPPEPKTFWSENSKTIVGALVGLIFGGILVWLLKPAFEKLGNTLAGWLSKLGSGWGFKRRYLTHLVEEYRGLNIRQEPPAVSVGGALAQHGRLAILGGPGTGKTTLLSYLTLTYARGQAADRLGLKEKRLPILVPLRQLKGVLAGDDGVGTLPAYLTKWYAELGIQPREDFSRRRCVPGAAWCCWTGWTRWRMRPSGGACRSGWTAWLPFTQPTATSSPPGRRGTRARRWRTASPS